MAASWADIIKIVPNFIKVLSYDLTLRQEDVYIYASEKRDGKVTSRSTLYTERIF